jgi:hypothetical protein
VLEQSNANFAFEIPNLTAQWRLRDVKLRCRAMYILQFRNSNEVAQVAEFHIDRIPNRYRYPSNKVMSLSSARTIRS